MVTLSQQFFELKGRIYGLLKKACREMGKIAYLLEELLGPLDHVKIDLHNFRSIVVLWLAT